jgi:phosphatidate cytidylyltransferase
LAVEEARGAGVTELQARVVSAAVLAPLAVAALVAGGFPFALFVALVAAIGFWEWTAIAGEKEIPHARVVCLIALVVALVAQSLHSGAWAIAPTAGPALAAALLAIFLKPLRWTLLGFIYLLVPCAGLIILRAAEPDGWVAILFILAVVWATDIAAFFAGRSIGGPKLWPRVSPKKTWSGALGGLVAALLAGGLTAALTGAAGFLAGVAIAAPLSVAAQAGDLLESAYKRTFGVKDSGSIIPGHGGVLDRVDGLIGAAAIAWLLSALGLGGGILSPSLPAAVLP